MIWDLDFGFAVGRRDVKNAVKFVWLVMLVCFARDFGSGFHFHLLDLDFSSGLGF